MCFIDNDFASLNGPVTAGGTTSILLTDGGTLNPDFDLTGRACLGADTADPYMYLCVRVGKSAAASRDFSLNPEYTTECIRISCQGELLKLLKIILLSLRYVSAIMIYFCSV